MLLIKVSFCMACPLRQGDDFYDACGHPNGPEDHEFDRYSWYKPLEAFKTRHEKCPLDKESIQIKVE